MYQSASQVIAQQNTQCLLYTYQHESINNLDDSMSVKHYHQKVETVGRQHLFQMYKNSL